MGEIDEYKPGSGRMLKEDSTVLNVADTLSSTKDAIDLTTAAVDAVKTAVDAVAALLAAPGLETIEQYPAYGQGGVFTFEAGKTVAKGQSATLAAAMPISAVTQVFPVIAVTNSAAEAVTVVLKPQVSADGGVTWADVYDATLTAITWTLVGPASGLIQTWALPPLNVCASLLQIVVVSVNAAGSDTATITARAGWRP